MPVFVTEIAGRGVLAFDAPDHAAARAFVNDEALRSDLTVLQHNGIALWDGAAAIAGGGRADA